MPKSVLKDLTDQRFGKLVVLERALSTSYGATRWKVRCDDPCGKETVVFSTALLLERTKSCGHGHARTHGQTGGRGGKPSGAYRAWHDMLQRCTNPNHEKYADYGGRGVMVCSHWCSFENFYADMGDRPHGMSLDRKIVDGGYDVGNCRWSTTREQSRNKRSTVVTLADVQEIISCFERGEKQASIARRFGIAANYIGQIVCGNVWPEVERPYLAHGKRSTNVLAGRRGAYVSWQHMIQRCTNPNDRSYAYYGGRGIRVCARWMSFQFFYADMGNRPVGTSIGRRKVDGNYEPDDCCWKTTLEQARNTRSSVVTFDLVQEIIGRYEHGETKASIGRCLGLASSYVGALVNGKAWTEIDRPYLNKVQP